MTRVCAVAKSVKVEERKLRREGFSHHEKGKYVGAD